MSSKTHKKIVGGLLAAVLALFAAVVVATPAKAASPAWPVSKDASLVSELTASNYVGTEEEADNSVVSVAYNGTTVYYTSLQAAFGAMNIGAAGIGGDKVTGPYNVQLLQSVNASAGSNVQVATGAQSGTTTQTYLELNGVTATIDLNGNTITVGAQQVLGLALNANAVSSNVTITSSPAGGAITGDVDGDVIIAVQNASTLTLTDVSVANTSDVTFAAGQKGSEPGGVGVFGGDSAADGEISVLNVSGSTSISGGTGYGISANNTKPSVQISVSGTSTVTGGAAGMYVPTTGTVDISGSAKISGGIGIAMTGPTLTVSGNPTIESTATSNTAIGLGTPQNQFAPAAVAVSNPGAGSYQGNGDISNVNIQGGTFNNAPENSNPALTFANADGSLDAGGEPEDGSITVTAGTFSSPIDTQYVDAPFQGVNEDGETVYGTQGQVEAAGATPVAVSKVPVIVSTGFNPVAWDKNASVTNTAAQQINAEAGKLVKDWAPAKDLGLTRNVGPVMWAFIQGDPGASYIVQFSMPNPSTDPEEVKENPTVPVFTQQIASFSQRGYGVVSFKFTNPVPEDNTAGWQTTVGSSPNTTSTAMQKLAGVQYSVSAYRYAEAPTADQALNGTDNTTLWQDLVPDNNDYNTTFSAASEPGSVTLTALNLNTGKGSLTADGFTQIASIGGKVTENIYSTYVLPGATVTLPAANAGTGSTFANWVDAGGTVYKTGDTVTVPAGGLTLTAVYGTNITLNYGDGVSGKYPNNAVRTSDGTVSNLPYLTAANAQITGDLTSPVSGFAIVGWYDYTNVGGTETWTLYENGDTIPASVKSLRAVYAPVEIVLTPTLNQVIMGTSVDLTLTASLGDKYYQPTSGSINTGSATAVKVPEIAAEATTTFNEAVEADVTEMTTGDDPTYVNVTAGRSGIITIEDVTATSASTYTVTVAMMTKPTAANASSGTNVNVTVPAYGITANGYSETTPNNVANVKPAEALTINVSPSADAGTVKQSISGTAYTLTATANTGWKFVNWTNGSGQVLGTGTTLANAEKFFGSNGTGNQIITANFEPSASVVERFYNKWSGEHLVTVSQDEIDGLLDAGWEYEGVAWYAPLTGTPVYRLYNPYSYDHFYTTDVDERNYLMTLGWQADNDNQPVFYSSTLSTFPVYQLFNPYEQTGTHLWTTSATEYNDLGELGWVKENAVFFASALPTVAE